MMKRTLLISISLWICAAACVSAPAKQEPEIAILSLKDISMEGAPCSEYIGEAAISKAWKQLAIEEGGLEPQEEFPDWSRETITWSPAPCETIYAQLRPESKARKIFDQAAVEFLGK